MADWDTNKPGDNDIISQYPANERAQRASVETIFGIDHHDEDDANQGFHEQMTAIGKNSDPPTFASGGRWYSKLVDGIYEAFYRDSDGNVIQWTDGGQTSLGRVRIIEPDNPTSHTAKFSENGGIVIFDSANDCTFTLPEQTTETLPAGWYVLCKNIGGGEVNIALEGTDTLRGAPLLQTPDQPVTLILEDDSDPNIFAIVGNPWIPTFITSDSLSTPPGTTPAKGAVYILSGSGTGAWAGFGKGDFAIHLGSDEYYMMDNPLSAAGSGYVYRKVSDGYAELFYQDSFGNISQLTLKGNPKNPDVLLLPDQGGDPSTLAGHGKVFGKDVGGTATPHAMDEAGNVRDLINPSSSAIASAFTGSGEQDLADPGYQVMPGGLVIQWGEGTINQDVFNQAVAFPLEFPNACLQFVCTGTVTDAEQTGNVGIGTTVPSATQGFVSNVDNTTHTFRWIAVGH